MDTPMDWLQMVAALAHPDAARVHTCHYSRYRNRQRYAHMVGRSHLRWQRTPRRLATLATSDQADYCEKPLPPRSRHGCYCCDAHWHPLDAAGAIAIRLERDRQ